MIVRKIRPTFDSQYRLLPCGCGGEAEYIEFDSGFWAAACTVCKRRGRSYRVRHTAQVNWNQGGERYG